MQASWVNPKNNIFTFERGPQNRIEYRRGETKFEELFKHARSPRNKLTLNGKSPTESEQN
jgi:hypothetical protein